MEERPHTTGSFLILFNELYLRGEKISSLEKEMASHSSILAWRIPWMVEPDRLHTVSPWDHKELDMTERLTLS